ncbi:hypothetical protein [Actinoplanes subglobosus]|uniref:Uncharacterized protein n=1 Tax=Actinoplanes subglobosus TaxID=1547892 RepID=A0ABV8IV75_9ACTN
MNGYKPVEKRTGLLSLLLDVFDLPVVVRVGTTLVSIGWISRSEGRCVLELDPDDLATAVEHLVLDSGNPWTVPAQGQEEASDV